MSVASAGVGARHGSERRVGRLARLRQTNVVGGVLGWVWLAVIIVPIYWIVITSLKPQSEFFTTNPLLPASPTLESYQLVLENDFVRYFANSVIVTLGTIIPSVAMSFMAAFAIVRGSGWLVGFASRYLLMG
ncbi:MAG: carbohydrate ABC transporter permease, partial [Nocardioidaceae bacterium]